MTPQTTINQRFKILRQHLGLNQEQMGKSLGLLQATISGIEKGKQTVTPQTIDLLHKKHGASKYWLIEGKGEMLENTPAKAAATPVATEGKEEFYQELKEENTFLKKRVEFLEQQLNRVYAMANLITGGKLEAGFKLYGEEAAALSAIIGAARGSASPSRAKA